MKLINIIWWKFILMGSIKILVEFNESKLRLPLKIIIKVLLWNINNAVCALKELIQNKATDLFSVYLFIYSRIFFFLYIVSVYIWGSNRYNIYMIYFMRVFFISLAIWFKVHKWFFVLLLRRPDVYSGWSFSGKHEIQEIRTVVCLNNILAHLNDRDPHILVSNKYIVVKYCIYIDRIYKMHLLMQDDNLWVCYSK